MYILETFADGINKAGFMCMNCDALRRSKIACVYTGLFSKHTVALWCSQVYS